MKFLTGTEGAKFELVIAATLDNGRVTNLNLVGEKGGEEERGGRRKGEEGEKEEGQEGAE